MTLASVPTSAALAASAAEGGGSPEAATAKAAPHKSRRVLNVLSKHSWFHVPGDFRSKVNLDNLLQDLEAAEAEEADNQAELDAKALADAIAAVQDAIANKGSPDDLAKTLDKPSKSPKVLDVLGNHAWDKQDGKFQSQPDMDNLLKDLEAAEADAAQKKNDADKKALDDAVAAVEKALANKGDPQERTKQQDKDLAKPSGNSAVKDVLAGHPWDKDDKAFTKIPDNEKLLNDLKDAQNDLARKQADDDRNALDDAIAAVEEAKANNKPPAEIAKGLAKPSKNNGVQDLLAPHAWDPDANNFKSPPDVDKLLNDLKDAKADAAKKKADDDKKAIDAAIAAVKDAIAKKSDPKDLEKALADPAKNEEVEKVLGPHTWSPKPPPGCFKSAPDYQKLLDDLELCKDAAARRKALDDAIAAVEDAIVGKLPKEKLPNKLEDPVKDKAVAKILKDNGWDPNNLKDGPASKPELEKLLKDLKKGKDDEDKRKAIDDAIAAVEDAKANNKPPADLAKGLKAPAKDDDVKDILAAHAPAPWDPKKDTFSPGAKPDHDKLLKDLGEAKAKAAPPPFVPPNSDYVDPENPPVAITTVSSEIKPTFDFGENNVMVMKLENVIVRLGTKCEPPIPPEANPKPFEEKQEFTVVFPELVEVIFDKDKPDAQPEGKVMATTTLNKKVMDIPKDIEVGVGSQTMSPWGSHKLLEGTKETELHYECHVASEFSMEELEDESCELLVELKVTVTAWLTGVNSAFFSKDGQPVKAPARARFGSAAEGAEQSGMTVS